MVPSPRPGGVVGEAAEGRETSAAAPARSLDSGEGVAEGGHGLWGHGTHPGEGPGCQSGLCVPQGAEQAHGRSAGCSPRWPRSRRKCANLRTRTAHPRRRAVSLECGLEDERGWKRDSSRGVAAARSPAPPPSRGGARTSRGSSA